MKGGKGGEEGKGMGDRPTKEGRKEGERTNGGDGKFSTHTLPKRYCCGGGGQTDETAAMAANGMAFISRQFADPSLHFAFLCKNSAAADKFVGGEASRENKERRS